jgi:hypothetical protein
VKAAVESASTRFALEASFETVVDVTVRMPWSLAPRLFPKLCGQVIARLTIRGREALRHIRETQAPRNGTRLITNPLQ